MHTLKAPLRTQKSKSAFTITVPTMQEVMKKSSAVARQSYVRGNASGIHGGAKPRYGKRERQQNRRELSRMLQQS
jgi:hypothetical protein